METHSLFFDSLLKSIKSRYLYIMPATLQFSAKDNIGANVAGGTDTDHGDPHIKFTSFRVRRNKRIQNKTYQVYLRMGRNASY